MAALGGAIKSTSRFDGADENKAKGIEAIDLIALSCLTFSLVHILIVCVFGSVIANVHETLKAIAVDDRNARNGVRRAN